MPKNAFGDEIVETTAPAGKVAAGEIAKPSFRQRLGVALAPGADSQVATAKGMGFDARQATPEEEHPPIVNQYVPEANPKALKGLLYKDASGGWQQFFPKDDYSKLAAHGIRDTAIAGSSLGGAMLGFASPVPGGTLAGAGLGAAGGDAAVDAVSGVLGTKDVRPAAEKLWGKVMTGLHGAAAEGGGQILGKIIKIGAGALASGGMELKEGAEGILSRMSDAGVRPSRGAIFTDPKAVAERAVAEKTALVESSIKGTPTTKQSPEEVGMAIREAAKSKAGFDPITQTVQNTAGPYFEGASRAYNAGLQQVRGAGAGGGTIELPETFSALRGSLSAWKETPNIGKAVTGDRSELFFKDLVKADGKMTFDNLRKWHTSLGKDINSTLARGEPVPDHVIEVFKAQTKDLETYAAQHGTQSALTTANSIWKTSTQEAGYVAPLLKARTGTATTELASSDLSPEAVGLIQKITSPDTFSGFSRNTLLKLGERAGDRSTPTRFDLDTLFTKVKSLDPRTVDMMLPPTVPSAKGPIPNPRRVELDAAVKSAEETGFFGMDAINKTPPNPIIKTLKDTTSATAKWLYLDKAADLPGMLRWFASANSIRSDATSKLLAFAGNIPNATVRDELVKKILGGGSTQPIDAKAKGE